MCKMKKKKAHPDVDALRPSGQRRKFQIRLDIWRRGTMHHIIFAAEPDKPIESTNFFPREAFNHTHIHVRHNSHRSTRKARYIFFFGIRSKSKIVLNIFFGSTRLHTTFFTFS